MKYLVTGGAGFVGSHIVDRLVKEGNEVAVYDNLSTGTASFLDKSLDKIQFIEADLLDTKKLGGAMEGIDFVFHMAANADIRDNLKFPLKCLEQNTIATSNVLEAMRKCDVKQIAFPSTGAIYGEPGIYPTPEDAPFPVQTSLYGASKLACEGLLQAYASGYGFRTFIFRFVSLMGERYSHGCVLDFYNALLKNPKKLQILGNGKQKKSYLHVNDCLDAMFTAIGSCRGDINIFNLGTEEYIEVTGIADIVCRELGLENVEYSCGSGERGWIGDSPFILPDTKKIKSLGWKPKFSIEQSVEKTVGWLKANQWALKRKQAGWN